MKNLNVLFIVGSLLLLSGCETLMTRGDIREAEQKQKVHDQVVTLQRNTAETNNRFSDIEDDLRSLNGKVEVLENRLSTSGQDKEKVRQMLEQQGMDSNKKLMILQEEVSKLNERMEAMSAELAAIKSAAMSEGGSDRVTAAPKGAFEIAEELFVQKEWRKAILNFQKFRDANPKSKQFAEATYKIGVSFQELGMKDEARTFYEEVIAKFPNSGEAKKAKTRLKSLKK